MLDEYKRCVEACYAQPRATTAQHPVWMRKMWR